MQWRAFQHNGTTYNLDHLHPFELEIEQPATAKDPARTYRFSVRFSLHCFSQSEETGDDPQLAYSDNRETRTFCFDRHRYSRRLPDIVRSIHTKRCSHTGKGNFFIVELIDDNGDPIEYEIYFDITRPRAGRAPMELFIQSAYVRAPASVPYRAKPKKISFFVIAHNRKTGKPIKTPR